MLAAQKTTKLPVFLKFRKIILQLLFLKIWNIERAKARRIADITILQSKELRMTGGMASPLYFLTDGPCLHLEVRLQEIDKGGFSLPEASQAPRCPP